MNKRWRMVFTLLIAVSLIMSACSSDDGGGDGDETKLLGIVSITADDAGNAKVIRGATQAVEALGWEVTVIDAAGSADQANAGFQNLVQSGADAILNLVFPATSLGAGLAAAKEAGVPVGSWGGGLDDGGVIVVANGAGGPQAKPVVEKMIADMGGEGAILALTYRTGEVCRNREDIFDEQVSATSIDVSKNEISIPGFLQDGAQFASAWLAAHAEGEGPLAIWGCWEDPTIGAISALKQQNRTDVLTYGENGAPDGLKAVQDGSLTATYWADSEREGEVLVEEIMKAIEAGDSWTPIEIDVPGVLVTADNVEEFLAEHPEELS